MLVGVININKQSTSSGNKCVETSPFASLAISKESRSTYVCAFTLLNWIFQLTIELAASTCIMYRRNWKLAGINITSFDTRPMVGNAHTSRIPTWMRVRVVSIFGSLFASRFRVFKIANYTLLFSKLLHGNIFNILVKLVQHIKLYFEKLCEKRGYTKFFFPIWPLEIFSKFQL